LPYKTNAGLKVRKKMKKNLPYLLITFICLLAFWQVAFFTQTLKYDILDGYLPGHFFLSECLRNNVFPLWNPYQQLGFPIYADLINTNYPVNMLIARLFPYTNITFHILFILYLIIAGTGAFKLSRQLKITDEISLLIGIAYPLSGFFTGNAQHMQFIIGAAWLPYALLFFIKLSTEGKIRNTLLFVLFACLLISGGYPPTAILLAYILCMVYFLVLIKNLKEKNIRRALSFSLHCGIAVMLIIALCSGLIISLWQSAPFVNRYIQLNYETSVSNPFTPESLISLISPLAPVVHPDLFHTDLSMNNLYFSSVMVMFFMYALFIRKNSKSLFILVAGILILLISFGDHFFIHKLFYDHVPFFNKFRHPSNLRVFTILFFLLFTGIQLSRYSPAKSENFTLFRRVYCLFLGIIFLTCLLSFVIIIKKAAGPFDFKPTMTRFLNDFGIFGPLFLQTSVILLINSVFLYFILIKKKNHLFFRLVFAMLIAETLAFTQINLPYTVTSKYNPLEIRNFLRNRPLGFPLPDHHILYDNTEQSVACIPLLHNTNTYAKTVSPYARYPFYLNGYYDLLKDSLLFKNVTGNKLLYFGDTILPVQFMKKFTVEKISPDTKYVFVDDSLYDDCFKNLRINSSGINNVKCHYFSPARLSFETFSQTSQLAVLLQNNYPGWKVYVDGKETRHYTVNQTLIGIILSPGKHRVTFEYRNRLYSRAAFFSFSLFFVLLILTIVLTMVETKKTTLGNVYTGSFFTLLIGIPVFFILRPVVPYAETQVKNNRLISHQLDKMIAEEKEKSISLVFNTESPDPFTEKYSRKNFIYQRFRLPVDGIKFWEILDTLKSEKLLYIWSNVLEIPEIRDIIQMHFPILTRQYTGDRYSVSLYSRGISDMVNPDFLYLNDFEGISRCWSMDRTILDSTIVCSGSYAEKLSPNREFGSTFRTAIDHVPVNGIRVFSALQFYRDGDQSCNLVITINRSNKTLYYLGIDLDKFCLNDRGWNKGFASQYYPESTLKKGDEIVVYCWNNGKNKAFYIDDFLVKIE
jgi:hypothetical protein